jgi:hypothetical protein
LFTSSNSINLACSAVVSCCRRCTSLTGWCVWHAWLLIYSCIPGSLILLLLLLAAALIVREP